MKKALILAAALSVTASVASAGGPVVVIDEGGPVVQDKARSGAALPLILGAIIIGAVVAGGSGT